MELFAPWFLAGLAGLALPFYLHLLKRQTNKPKAVSSLMTAHPLHEALREYLTLRGGRN